MPVKVKGSKGYIDLIKQIEKYQTIAVNTKVSANAFAYVKGRMFDRWIDTSGSRSSGSSGFTEGDLITNPAYCIESLLRDECFSFRDKKITEITDSTHIIMSSLHSSVDDYYNNAVYYNIETQHKTFVIDFIGATKTLVLNDADIDSAVGNNVILQNIQGNEKIDDVSFDRVGNSTDGERKDWIFARDLIGESGAEDSIQEILSDCHCALFRNPKYRLVSYDPITIPDGTFSNPLKEKGNPLISLKTTNTDSLYSSFRMKYGYDYASGEFLYDLFCDEENYSLPDATWGLSAYAPLCKEVREKYKVNRRWETESYWIYDHPTALALFKRKIKYFTKPRANIFYVGSPYDHAQYQEGDKVLIDFPDYLPEGANNVTQFMINGIMYQLKKGAPEISFKLTELVSA